MKSPRPDAPVQSITQLPDPLSEDQARRMRNYLIQMSIRVACFLGCVLIDHWVRWILAGFAVVLPYVAVLLVNAGRDTTPREIMTVDRLAIETGRTAPQDDDDAPSGAQDGASREQR